MVMISIIWSLPLIRKNNIHRLLNHTVWHRENIRECERTMNKWKRRERKKKRKILSHMPSWVSCLCVKEKWTVWRKGRKEGKYRFFAIRDNPHFNERGCFSSYRIHYICFLFLVKVVLCLVVQRKIKNIFLEKIKIKNKFEKQKNVERRQASLLQHNWDVRNSTLIVENRVPMVLLVHFTVLLQFREIFFFLLVFRVSVMFLRCFNISSYCLQYKDHTITVFIEVYPFLYQKKIFHLFFHSLSFSSNHHIHIHTHQCTNIFSFSFSFVWIFTPSVERMWRVEDIYCVCVWNFLFCFFLHFMLTTGDVWESTFFVFYFSQKRWRQSA